MKIEEMINSTDQFTQSEIELMKLVKYCMGRTLGKITYSTTKTNRNKIENMYNIINDFLKNN